MLPALPLLLSPLEVAFRCRHLPGLVFFDSALQSGETISIVAAKPTEIVTGRSEQDWQMLQAKIAARQRSNLHEDEMLHGFAAGTIDYDGSFQFGFYDQLLRFRHIDASWSVLGDLPSEFRGLPGLTNRCAPVEFKPQISREDFCHMVRQAKEFIAAGDIYQVNLSHKFSASWCSDALSFYEVLRRLSPAPQAAYLDLGRRQVLSSSPELFLKMNGAHIQTRPIKGTRPRRSEESADEASAHELITSQKEIAELIMITDLERNDLGQVCEYGSVRVTELLKLHRYEQVFHLVSTVEGCLRDGVDQVAALRACFPGGSITGAPKKRAMEIIEELEPVDRGLYTGAIGWFGFNGTSQFNIAIRTLILENEEAHFHVGAGIVADSQPEAEYEETLHKAGGILQAARFFNLRGAP